MSAKGFEAWWHREHPNLPGGSMVEDTAIAKAAWTEALEQAAKLCFDQHGYPCGCAEAIRALKP